MRLIQHHPDPVPEGRRLHRVDGSTGPLLLRHIDDARQLVVVLQLCIEKDVALLFG
ncbi:hypothetical protein OIB37_34750 [Streptomyces sp. NBC_00820]|uniref:hypothetical protein n=1 Tax=Streptomyces sp. NBC_00820 TaxID=2975842 RepID=UPI002ED08D3A|nr:hypothetical protein OIB37_34750 [Streptomyces sp. NBC_00820]